MNLLLLEDNKNQSALINDFLSDNFKVIKAYSLSEAKKKVSSHIDIIVADIRIDKEKNAGISYLKWVKRNFPQIPIIMITGYGNVSLAVEAMKLGAEDFLEKPLDLEKLELIINKVLKRKRIEEENIFLKKRLEKLEQNRIIGSSKIIQEIREKIKIAAEDGDVNVFIQGETGTGKELIANAIHKSGKRSNGPFISESLKAKEGELLPGLLFGYEKGAFTDAKSKYKGLFEQAAGGVLFLDEIAELDEGTQSKLLRIIEKREFTRLGGTKEISVDFQLITATSQDIEKLVESNKLRKELYYRLVVFPIYTPSLRDHKEDIPELANYFLYLLSEEGRTTAKEIKNDVIDALMKKDWKGNIRELRSFIETAAIYANVEKSKKIGLNHFEVFGLGKKKDASLKINVDSVEKKKAKVELNAIEDALQNMEGRKGEIYKVLGYSHRDYPRRKVKNIKKRFPDLIDKFTLIKKAYFKKKN